MSIQTIIPPSEYGIRFLSTLNNFFDKSFPKPGSAAPPEYQMTQIVTSWKDRTVKFCLTILPDRDEEASKLNSPLKNQISTDKEKILTAIQGIFPSTTSSNHPLITIEEENQIWIEFKAPLPLPIIHKDASSRPNYQFEFKEPPKQELPTAPPPREMSFCAIS